MTTLQAEEQIADPSKSERLNDMHDKYRYQLEEIFVNEFRSEKEALLGVDPEDNLSLIEVAQLIIYQFKNENWQVLTAIHTTNSEELIPFDDMSKLTKRVIRIIDPYGILSVPNRKAIFEGQSCIQEYIQYTMYQDRDGIRIIQ